MPAFIQFGAGGEVFFQPCLSIPPSRRCLGFKLFFIIQFDFASDIQTDIESETTVKKKSPGSKFQKSQGVAQPHPSSPCHSPRA